jgi:hypothetical protein
MHISVCCVLTCFCHARLCALPSSGICVCLQALNGTSCVNLCATFERLIVHHMRTCVAMLDFVWGSVVDVEALRDVLILCLTEAEPWSPAGFTVCFKLPRSCLAPGLLGLHFFQNDLVYASVILFSP